MSLYRYHMISIFTQTGDELSRNRPAPETRYFSSCAFSVMIDYKLYWTGQFFLLFIHLFMCFNIKYHSFLLLNITAYHESHISTILLLLLYYFIFETMFWTEVAQLSIKASLHVALYKTIKIFPKNAVDIDKIQYILTYLHL